METNTVVKTIKNRNRVRSTLIRYTAATAGCAVFGFVYECFSHEVFSPFMYLAFLIPLVLGIIPYMLILVTDSIRPSALSADLYAFGIAVLTVGSIMQGVLEIYGTTNRLMIIYLIAGFAMVISGVISYTVSMIIRCNVSRE